MKVVKAAKEQALKLNGRLQREGKVEEYLAVAPDSRYAAYAADQQKKNVTELFLVDLKTPGEPARLNGPIHSGGDVYNSFRFTPDSGSVVYVADQDIDNKHELYMVSVTAPGEPLKLSGPMPDGGDVGERFIFTPDGKSLIYLGSREKSTVMELYIVSLDKPSDAVKLSGELRFTGDVGPNFIVDQGGRQVAYYANHDVMRRFEAYAVTLDKPGEPVRLNPPVGAFQDVKDLFRFSPDGDYLVYLSNFDSRRTWELYRVAMNNPGSAIKLSGPLASGGDVSEAFEFSPDGTYLVYAANGDDDDDNELYMVDQTKPGDPRKVNGPLVKNGDVLPSFAISPDSRRIIYVADEKTNNTFELFMVESARPGKSTRLSGKMMRNGDAEEVFAFSPDGTSVAYLASQDSQNSTELYLVHVDKPGKSKRLSDRCKMGDTRVTHFTFTPDGEYLLYVGNRDFRRQRKELYKVKVPK